MGDVFKGNFIANPYSLKFFVLRELPAGVGREAYRWVINILQGYYLWIR